jgi:hypothetical protein
MIYKDNANKKPATSLFGEFDRFLDGDVLSVKEGDHEGIAKPFFHQFSFQCFCRFIVSEGTNHIAVEPGGSLLCLLVGRRLIFKYAYLHFEDHEGFVRTVNSAAVGNLRLFSFFRHGSARFCK